MEFRETKETKKGYTTEYVIMENIQDNLKWTTFGGVDRNGRQCSRSFNVEISEDQIPFFKEQRIKVGEWMPKNSNDPEANVVYTVSVTVDMDHQEWYPCNIYLARSEEDDPVRLSKDQLKELDNVGFNKVDVKCRKKRNSKDPSMFVLYLNQGYFYQAVDEFEMEHRPHKKSSDTSSDGFSMPAPETDSEEEMPFV